MTNAMAGLMKSTPMETHTKGSSRRVRLTAKGFTLGLIQNYMMANGTKD
jgi:predicted transcriptional regulator